MAKKPKTEVDRLPPHSDESEQGVLGCCLLDPIECIGMCQGRFKAGPDVFYDERNQVIYRVMVEMWENRQPIDLSTLRGKLKEVEDIDYESLFNYAQGLQDATPSATNLPYFADIVVEKHLLRETLRTATRIVDRAHDCNGDGVAAFLDEAERNILAIRQSVETGRGVANIQAVEKILVGDYEDAYQRKSPPGYLTGLSDLDRKLGGLLGQDLVIIGGEPSAGKTTLMLNLAVRLAQRSIIVSVHSLETSTKKLIHRVNCMVGKLDGGGFMRGEVTVGEMQQMAGAISLVSKMRDCLLIHDDGNVTEGSLTAACRRDYQAGARVFFLDYLQLLQAEGEGETEQVTNAVKCCKRIAKELDCPIVVVSSLNRDFKDGKPKIRNLRQSGQIEYDGDKVLLLSCEDRDAAIRKVGCDIAKNKDGELGQVWFTLFASQFRMEPAAHESEEDMPKHKRHYQDD